MRTRLLVLLSLAVVVLVSACSKPAASQVQAVADSVPAVAVVRAERRSLSRSAEVAAEFRPYEEVDLHAKIAGYLKAIYVDVGDRVQKGQLIGLLEVPEYGQDLAQAEAAEKRSQLDVIRSQSEVARTQSAVDNRKLTWERMVQVSKVRPGLIAQQEIDNAAARYQEAEGQLATARAVQAATEQQVQVSAVGRSRVRTMMDYLRITAPFSGVITKRYANTGSMIQAGTASQTQAMPVVRISQVDTLRLVFPVPESLVPRVHTGSPVEIRVEALKRVFQGKVTRCTGRLEASTRTMETEVDLKNPGGAILPGMFGNVSLLLDSQTDAIVVPIQAVSGADTAPVVFVVNPSGAVEERKIQSGLETPGLMQVISGLAENEQVVIGNRSGLVPGKRVNVRLLKLSDVLGKS